MVACPDCGTPNRVDAELCVQCWRGMNAALAARIPTPAFAGSSGAPPPPAPAGAAQMTIQAVTPREADPGAVPYFAAVGGAPAVPAPSFPLSSPSTSDTTKPAPPWGAIVTLTVLVALLAGGYLFFFGGKSGAYSPDDGAYSVTLPAGWEPVEGLEAQQLDVAVESGSNQSAIMLFHYPVPGGVSKEQMTAGMSFARQFMPQFPGLTLGPMQESTVLTGEGITSYEMSAKASQGIVPGAAGGKMTFVFGVDEGSPNLVMLMVACAEADCPAAEATFSEMAKTFEFSG